MHGDQILAFGCFLTGIAAGVSVLALATACAFFEVGCEYIGPKLQTTIQNAKECR